MKKINNFFSFLQTNSNTVKNILLIVLLIFVLLSLKKCNDNKNIINDFKKVTELQKQQIKYWQDDSGRVHSQIEAISADKVVIQTLYKKELDSLGKELKVKSDQIKEYVSIISQSHGEGEGHLEQVTDTVYKYNSTTKIKIVRSVLPVNDGYLNFVANINKDSSFKYHYTYTDSLSIKKYTVKYGLFNLKERTYLDVTSKNKNAKITGLTQFSVDDNIKTKRFSVVLGPGLSWTGGTTVKPTVNLTVGVKLFSF